MPAKVRSSISDSKSHTRTRELSKRLKASKIAEILAELYTNPSPPLRHSSAYTLLVAVLLSAQCTDERVNKITPKLFAMARSPQAMAKLKVAKIEETIRPCGLAPRKAHAISELSRIIVNQHKGRVPKTFEALEELPGVGHKTASVVMSQAFGFPAFPVDTHIHRLAERWGLSSGKNVEQTEKDLKALFPEERWNDLHLQIIFYGREHCPARGHDPAECQICSLYGRKET